MLAYRMREVFRQHVNNLEGLNRNPGREVKEKEWDPA